MTKDEVLLRLCRVAAKVREHEPLTSAAGQSLAADCFCDQSAPRDEVAMEMFRDMGLSNFRFDEEVMKFIEGAVEKALQP